LDVYRAKAHISISSGTDYQLLDGAVFAPTFLWQALLHCPQTTQAAIDKALQGPSAASARAFSCLRFG
jgi:hypothetical protein